MLKKRLWLGLTTLLAFILVILICATMIAMDNEEIINNALHISTSRIVNPGDPDYPEDAGDHVEVDSEYFKSEFGELNEENQKKLIEAGWEQNVNEMKEGAALLKNDNNALPLSTDDRVSLFGHAQVDPLFAGVSAGSKPNAGYNPTLYDAMIADGFAVNTELYEMLKGTGTTRGAADMWGVWTYGSSLNSEDPISVYTDEIRSTWANDYNDAAIVMFARQGGEHEDMNMYDMKAYTDQERDYDYRNSTREGRQSAMALIPQEKDLLGMLKSEKEAGRIKKIIVLLNTSSQMEVDWLDEYDVDACMFVGALGAQGARGISSILSGETNPSGHIVDTYAVDSRSAPACVNSLENTPTYTNYEEIEEYTQENTQDQWVNKGSGAYLTFQAESIYIGYKYYETRYEDSVFGRGNASSAKGASRGASEWAYENEVVYPFGYGLSYTTFSQTLGDVTYDADTDLYKVEATVKNTGDVAGKSVVQVYAQTPYGDYERENKVEKSAVQLVGFGKTDILEPGESETVIVDVERYLLASYDYVGAKGYILSEGTYYLAIGDNAHDALNNIIRAKDPGVSGLVAVGGGDAEGDADKVWSFESDLDTQAYRLSSEGAVVTNRFDDCDLNYWVDGAGTYLSRSDWDGTYPTEPTTVAATREMMDLLKGEYYEKPADSPTVAEATADWGKSAGINFVTMKDIEWGNDVAWEQFLKQMTLEELITVVNCQGGRQPITSVALPETKVGDGCDGIGASLPFAYEDTTGVWGSGRIEAGRMTTTRYASKTILTGTFNRDLYERRGELMGEEGLWTKCTENWGVGANLHRTPFNGRAFEYMSEDANMNYMAAAPEVKAMESKGMLAGVKHFAANDQEWQRTGVSTFFNEQAFREGALRGFEGAIRVGKASSLMQAFNRIGLRFASSCPALNIDVCDNEWGFEGHKETDATSSQENGYLSHYATMLSSGTDTFCYNTVAAGILLDQIESTDDGYFVDQYVLKAGKNFFYAMSRSNAINGLTSDSIVLEVTPWWQIGLGVLIAVFAVLFVAGAVLLVLSKVRSEKRSA